MNVEVEAAICSDAGSNPAATALAKQYDAVLPILKERLMDSWSHNKAIQKARESYRITPQQKEYLSTLKV